VLAENGVLSSANAERYRLMAQFRNRVVHYYETVEPDQVYTIVCWTALSATFVVLFGHGKRHGHTGAEARRVGHGADSRLAGRAPRLEPHAPEPRTVCALELA
jgi:hypothetical protein